MNSEEILILKQALANTTNIVIVGHKNPDGDAIGSCLGLANFLKQLEHQVTVVMPNDFPEFLKWIPETQTIINYELDSRVGGEDSPFNKGVNFSALFFKEFYQIKFTDN